MDAIIVNDVSDPEIGFNSKENAVTLIHENGELIFEKQSKIELANNIIEQLITIFSLTSKPYDVIADREKISYGYKNRHRL